MDDEVGPRRRVYLMRCWRDNEATDRDKAAWQFWVEVIAPERRQKRFVSLDDLIAFIRADLGGYESRKGATQ